MESLWLFACMPSEKGKNCFFAKFLGLLQAFLSLPYFPAYNSWYFSEMFGGASCATMRLAYDLKMDLTVLTIFRRIP